MTRGIEGIVVFAAYALMAAAALAADVNPGEAAYRRYCAACHGLDGKGDGVAAGTMRPKPSNLTLLAKKNGGKFPYVTVKNIIDGRKRVAAHGESDMPVWGQVFTEEKGLNPATAAEVRGQVQSMTDYLVSIQAH